MRSFSLLSFILVILVVNSHASPKEKLFKKYGMMKIFESCFGEDTTKEYFMKMKEAAYKCKMMPMEELSRKGSSSSNSGFNRFSSSFDRNKDEDRKSPFRGNSPMALKGIDWSSLLPEGFQQTKNGVTYVPFPILIPSDKIRSKRDNHQSDYYDREMVNKLMMKMDAKVSNKTCIAKELGYLDSRLDINTDYMLSEINKMDVDYRLKEDLQEGVRECSDFVNCIPINNKRYPYPPHVKKMEIFTKCSMKNKLSACMKKDLRKKSSMFDLDQFGGFMQGADDDEKMLAILWAKTEFGGEGFGF